MLARTGEEVATECAIDGLSKIDDRGSLALVDIHYVLAHKPDLHMPAGRRRRSVGEEAILEGGLLPGPDLLSLGLPPVSSH